MGAFLGTELGTEMGVDAEDGASVAMLQTSLYSWLRPCFKVRTLFLKEG